MKRGRPKGRSRDNRSFGPLGDLIRSHRLAKGLGLLDVAKACDCSVQFVSNIEHGRAPLPWEKVGPMAVALRRSQLKIFKPPIWQRSAPISRACCVQYSRGRKTATPMVLSKMTGTASAVAFAAKDNGLREVIQKYQTASLESRKKFVKSRLCSSWLIKKRLPPVASITQALMGQHLKYASRTLLREGSGGFRHFSPRAVDRDASRGSFGSLWRSVCKTTPDAPALSPMATSDRVDALDAVLPDPAWERRSSADPNRRQKNRTRCSACPRLRPAPARSSRRSS